MKKQKAKLQTEYGKWKALPDKIRKSLQNISKLCAYNV